MKHFFILLLAVLCLAHLVSTGGRYQKKGGKNISELEKRLSAMEKQVGSMMDCCKETKAGFEELRGKVDKMLMLFAKKFPKFFCAICPKWRGFDGCNWCWCHQPEGMVVCTKKYCGPNNVCTQPPKTGPCEAMLPRYYYNHKDQRCMNFNYGGCGGNDNNFETLEKCQRKCGDKGCPPVVSNKLCIREGSCQRSDGSPGCDAGLICCPDSPSCGFACMKRALVTGCSYKGKVYSPGTSFPAGDGCNTCFCKSGTGSSGLMVACTLKACPGCTYNGCLYKVGENIPPDDGCNTCFCSANGVIGCTKIGCPAQTKCPKTFPIPPHQQGTHVRQCSGPRDCPKGKICCAKDCHHVCVDEPKPPSDLVCPTLPYGMAGICLEACGGGCGDKLCCSNGCGHLCKTGVEPNPNCPVFKRQCLVYPSEDFCRGDCKKGEECCKDGCGGSICMPVLRK